MERASFGAGSFDTAPASNEHLQPSRFTRPIVTEIVLGDPVLASRTIPPASQHEARRCGLSGGRRLCPDYRI
jgi:hypothetical protein